MIEHQILIAIAQIAITLTGFSGAVAALSKDLSKSQKRELGTLLTQSGIALFASLIPLIFSSADGGSLYTAEKSTFWIVSSAIYIAICSVALLFYALDIYERKAYKYFNYDIFFYLSFFGVIAALTINVFYIKDSSLYCFALVTNLAYGFMTFVRLVVPSEQDTSK